MTAYSHWMAAFEGFAYKLLLPLLLCNNKPTTDPKSDLDTLTMTDEEIDKAANTSPKVDAGNFYVYGLEVDAAGEYHTCKLPNAGFVSRITENIVAKNCSWAGQHEILSARLVRENTCIPVPRHYRLSSGPTGYHLTQEYIPGRNVWSAWAGLSWWQRLRIALTLRYYIYQLRCISVAEGTSIFPGPPAVDGKPQLCEGRLFTSEGSGPFRTYRELSRWYQNRLLVLQEVRKEGFGVKQFDDSSPLVFTHFDLHPQNLILGDDGQLWVIDWADAGWYPLWFEGASMDLFLRNQDLEDIPGWATMVPFIAGNYKHPGQLPFILAISYTLEVMMANIMNLIDEVMEV